MGFDLFGMRGATEALYAPYKKRARHPSGVADRPTEGEARRVIQAGNVTVVELGAIASGPTGVPRSDPLTDPRHPDARPSDHNRRTLNVDLATAEHNEQLDEAQPTLYRNGPPSLNVDKLSILQRLGPILAVMVAAGTLGALLNVQCGGDDHPEASIDPKSKSASQLPATCAEGNRATEFNIRNRRVQLEQGVDTVILDCDDSGRVIGQCIFSNAQWPGGFSRPRTAEEGVDKIWYIEQGFNTRCREYGKNLINWANNYDMRQDVIVLPREVKYELIKP